MEHVQQVSLEMEFVLAPVIPKTVSGMERPVKNAQMDISDRLALQNV
jgi:hypothetical protein